MKPDLCITIRFIQPFPLFHGRRDAEQPEWPPSPMRAFQALLNAASLRARGRSLAPEVRQALQALEVLRPEVIAPRATVSAVGYRAYVPHNQTDLVTAAWHRGNLDASIASHRMEKDYRPLRVESIGDDLPALHYVYSLDATAPDPDDMLRVIRPAVRAITHLGCGIDQVVADATLVDSSSIHLPGERWLPSAQSGRRLRVHRSGSLDALINRHNRFLNRLQDGWTPVPPLTADDMDQVRYRRDTDPLQRPHVLFKLVDENDDTVNYPHSQLIHIAGMVRHLAVELMKRHPPRDLKGRTTEQWVEQYVAGHQSVDDKSAGLPHVQLSYVPLPSTGHAHTNPAIRRVMIVAPAGDEAWLEHLVQRLDGQLLKPLPDTKLPPGTHLQLIPEDRKDGVRDAYTRDSRTWASFTPVILPGHDDRKPEKTRKLIVKALAQSGIDQPCEFEWSAFSHFPKSYSAHKYVRDESATDGKRRIGYIRPNHLLDQTAVHLVLRFGRREDPNDPDSRWIPAEEPIPGPLTIGAGRHCGFGLMAGVG
ncbi:MAG: type I-U CRISPR-associated protein Cas5/Cas6 [Pirellulales bacterium]|nr:type I-U CRISPR-associated protein Cas5/Cas6 [Pirellulales bacterium]